MRALADAQPKSTYAFLKRLGPSEVFVGGDDDLATALRITYELRVTSPTPRPHLRRCFTPIGVKA
jgi:hypothetical protein